MPLLPTHRVTVCRGAKEECQRARTRRRQGMEIVMGERIVSFESTLALGAAIALGLYNQNRAAQRAVR